MSDLEQQMLDEAGADLDDTGRLAQMEPITSPGDTGSFETIERIARIETAGGGEPVVYGLGVNKADDEKRHERNNTIRLVVGGLVAALALLGYLVFAQPFSLPFLNGPDDAQTAPTQPEDEDAQTQDEATDAADAEQATPDEVDQGDPEEPQAPEPNPNWLTNAEVTRLANELNFDGTDVSVDAVTGEVGGTRVIVYHTIADDTPIDPTTLAGRAAQRAAALANVLKDAVVDDGTGGDRKLTDVTWVARNGSKDAYIAVWFPVGEAPTSGNGLDVLASSPSYRMSDSLFVALGSWFPQSVGDVPTTPSGEGIWPSATLPGY